MDYNNIAKKKFKSVTSVTGEEKPLFEELFSILDENYKTINNAQFLNSKRLVQNYWSRREDIDLRMKVGRKI